MKQKAELEELDMEPSKEDEKYSEHISNLMAEWAEHPEPPSPSELSQEPLPQAVRLQEIGDRVMARSMGISVADFQ